jgi:cell growth-regulating nucleolar protein
MVTFYGTDYRSHTSCMTEAQKYQGALYRPEHDTQNGKKGKKGKNGQANNNGQNQQRTPNKVTGANGTAVAPKPEVNVFDYMVGAETPNASTLNLAAAVEQTSTQTPSASKSTVRFSQIDESSQSTMVEYGTGPVPAASAIQTPSSKSSKSKKEETPATASQTDKKRKRLHVDTDVDMSDAPAPPTLAHSGLTGGLQRMMAPGAFPPSPEESRDNSSDASDSDSDAAPASKNEGKEKKGKAEEAEETPLKRAKRGEKDGKDAKKEKNLSRGLLEMMAGTGARKVSGEREAKKAKKARKDSSGSADKAGTLILHPTSSTDAAAHDLQVSTESMRLAKTLLDTVEGEGDRGISLNKALKRYHKVRDAKSKEKEKEEKELFKALRLRKNDRGEIVVFF